MSARFVAVDTLLLSCASAAHSVTPDGNPAEWTNRLPASDNLGLVVRVAVVAAAQVVEQAAALEVEPAAALEAESAVERAAERRRRRVGAAARRVTRRRLAPSCCCSASGDAVGARGGTKWPVHNAKPEV
ncbi:MAG: hypothetical protein AB1938_25645 [Myxococcota bacterium]